MVTGFLLFRFKSMAFHYEMVAADWSFSPGFVRAKLRERLGSKRWCWLLPDGGITSFIVNQIPIRVMMGCEGCGG